MTLRRIAAYVPAVLVAVALTGCPARFATGTLGLPDPVVDCDHADCDAGGTGPGGGGASPGRAATSRSETRFSGRVSGRFATTTRITYGPRMSHIRNARIVGSFKASSSDPSLGPLQEAEWHGRLSIARDRLTRKNRARGLVIATFTDPAAGRACLRLGYRNRGRDKRRGRGIVTVLGGEGGARTLAGSASTSVVVRDADTIALRGTVRPAQRAERGMTPACRKLERQFGLKPLD